MVKKFIIKHRNRIFLVLFLLILITFLIANTVVLLEFFETKPAVLVCQGLSAGDACTFDVDGRQISGLCIEDAYGDLYCQEQEVLRSFDGR